MLTEETPVASGNLAFTDRQTSQLIAEADLPSHQLRPDVHVVDQPHRPMAGEMAAFCEQVDGAWRLGCPSCDATIVYVDLAGLSNDEPVCDERFRRPGDEGPAVHTAVHDFRCSTCGERGFPQWRLGNLA